MPEPSTKIPSCEKSAHGGHPKVTTKIPTFEQPPHVPKPPTKPSNKSDWKLPHQPPRSKDKPKHKHKSKDKAQHKMDNIAKDISAQQMQMQSEEDPSEAAMRKNADFASVESQLNVKRFSWQDAFDFGQLIGGFLGYNNPFTKKANPKEDIVW
jgi:hypothetical protein